jgi:hypothetical protein
MKMSLKTVDATNAPILFAKMPALARSLTWSTPMAPMSGCVAPHFPDRDWWIRSFQNN